MPPQGVSAPPATPVPQVVPPRQLSWWGNSPMADAIFIYKICFNFQILDQQQQEGEMCDAAMPIVCCRSLIITMLMSSLKRLGRMDGLKHLMSPTLGVAWF